MENDAIKAKNEGQYLTFLLNSQNYGIPIGAVREINEFSEIIPIPRTPDFVIGVMNLRGKVVPVVDLRMKFGMERIQNTAQTCIIVIDTTIGQVGSVVDAVCEVVTLSSSQIEPPPVLGEASELRFVTGIGLQNEKLIILVDIVSALSKEEFMKMQLPTDISQMTKPIKGSAA
ncbi:MAG: purine-binding chemotaxis protein CheW [Bdellovibrionaceae bacterium]|nr:purine-binding chemotaxis protein CheW [Bdellovibrio sp.]